MWSGDRTALSSFYNACQLVYYTCAFGVTYIIHFPVSFGKRKNIKALIRIVCSSVLSHFSDHLLPVICRSVNDCPAVTLLKHCRYSVQPPKSIDLSHLTQTTGPFLTKLTDSHPTSRGNDVNELLKWLLKWKWIETFLNKTDKH